MMTDIDYRELAVQAYEELTGESVPVQSLSRPARPTLEDALARAAPLPPKALLLGQASDGLPVLLDLCDPSPGPLLIAGDEGSGKTACLQMATLAASRLHQPGELQFCVLTRQQTEWDDLSNLPHCVGVFDARDGSAHEFICDLAAWARQQRRTEQSVLLMFDDLTLAESLPLEAGQSLRWLLVRGPNRGIWPLVTLEARRMEQARPWLEAFHTRILGPIREREQAEALAGTACNVALSQGQFALREGRGWLKFWVPEFEDIGG